MIGFESLMRSTNSWCSLKAEGNRGFIIIIIIIIYNILPYWGFPHSSVGKESSCNTGDTGLNLGREDPLEKEMATHSSILAWRILWTEEPGRLQSVRSPESDIT